MSDDTMPCGCLGHYDYVKLCEYPKLAKAFKQYACHDKTCDLESLTADSVAYYHPLVCTCGMQQVLNSIAQRLRFYED